MELNAPQIILASASPRRRELLDQIGIRYSVRPADTDERVRPGESAQHYVLRVAAEKSLRALDLSNDELPILGADTAVVLEGEVLGKPENRNEALKMLRRLSGRRHAVMSAVSLRAKGGRHWQAFCETAVTFREIEADEMVAYWNSGEPADKAGAYAIQGLGAVFVKSIEGSFSGVVGLPLYETAEILREAGIFSLKPSSPLRPRRR